MTRIIVAFPKVENGKNIKNVLVRNGYQVVCVCTNGAQVIQEANGLQDGLVLCTYKLSDMIYQELAECPPPGFDRYFHKGSVERERYAGYRRSVCAVENP